MRELKYEIELENDDKKSIYDKILTKSGQKWWKWKKMVENELKMSENECMGAWVSLTVAVNVLNMYYGSGVVNSKWNVAGHVVKP